MTSMPDWEIREGEALTLLRSMPDESVHCAVTSPPYWGLRKYGSDPGMIGLEPTFNDHLSNLVEVFREVGGCCETTPSFWLNYGDAYAGSGKGHAAHHANPGLSNSHERGGDTRWKQSTHKGSSKVPPNDGWRDGGLKPKDLMMMPARVAMALQDDGWWLRSEIIWHKPNPMPESVTDRPTNAHEKLFLLTKNARYFYDDVAVREAHH